MPAKCRCCLEKNIWSTYCSDHPARLSIDIPHQPGPLPAESERRAGPRRAAQWVKKYGDPRGKDIDTVVDWIERIPYTETRSYVQRVMENYEVYRMRISGRFDIVGDLRNGRG